MNTVRLKKVQVDALHAELCNLGYTPYIVVYTERPDVVIPDGFANHLGLITLDISAKAITGFKPSETELTYMASFNRKMCPVTIPYAAILAICAKENLDLNVNLSLLEDIVQERGMTITTKPNKSWADSAYLAT